MSKTPLHVQWWMEEEKAAVVCQLSKVQDNIWMLNSHVLAMRPTIENHKSHQAVVFYEILSSVKMT